MVDRVCLGRRSASEIGLFISKPGVDVLSSANADLLFSSSIMPFQMVSTGQVAVPSDPNLSAYGSIFYPNLGYVPTVLILPHITAFRSNFDPNNLQSYPSIQLATSSMTNTGCRVHAFAKEQTYTGVCTYGVMRRPYNG